MLFHRFRRLYWRVLEFFLARFLQFQQSIVSNQPPFQIPASNSTIRPVRHELVAPLQPPSLCHLPRRCFNSSASRRSPICPPATFNFAPKLHSEQVLNLLAAAVMVIVRQSHFP
ncbi:hypothetical protein LXL04_031219, partial [Taraxacum kok-saghyz]